MINLTQEQLDELAKLLANDQDSLIDTFLENIFRATQDDAKNIETLHETSPQISAANLETLHEPPLEEDAGTAETLDGNYSENISMGSAR